MVVCPVVLALNDDDVGDEVNASDEETIHTMFTYKFWMHSTKVAVITK